MRHGFRKYALHGICFFFFSKSLLTASGTATLPSKNFIFSSSVLTFFIHFSIISFCCFTCSSRYDPAILQVRLFVGFRHLEGTVVVQYFGLLFSLV